MLACEVQHLRVLDRVGAVFDKFFVEVDLNGEADLDDFVLRRHEQHELNERSIGCILLLRGDVCEVIASKGLRKMPRFEGLLVECRVLLVGCF